MLLHWPYGLCCRGVRRCALLFAVSCNTASNKSTSATEAEAKAMELLETKNIEVKENIRVKSYIDNMDLHLLACDLVICRSGALSVAETTVCGKAAIFVPFPEATGNHQYYNAKAVADKGGAILIEEKNLVLEDVVKEVLSLKNNPDKLKAMSMASRACAPDKALDIICGKIIEDCK